MPPTPWHVRAARKYGQMLVLYAALALSAPGEYSLARMSGWSTGVAWLMPAVMSLYAAIGASVSKAQTDAAKRCVGTSNEASAKRRAKSATWGALMALFLATAAQITDHLLTADVVGPRVWVLVAVSSVPPLVAAHVLHIDPPADAGATQTPREAPAQEPQAAVSAHPVEPVEEETPKPTEAPYTPVLVSYGEAALALGVAPETVRGWANKGTVIKYDGLTPSTRRVDLVECRNVQGRRVAASV